MKDLLKSLNRAHIRIDEASKDYTVVLQVSDWNMQDKFYEAPEKLVKEFKKHILSQGMQKAWDWWVGNVDFGDKETKGNPIKFGKVNMGGGVDYFLDFNEPEETVKEWDI